MNDEIAWIALPIGLDDLAAVTQVIVERWPGATVGEAVDHPALGRVMPVHARREETA